MKTCPQCNIHYPDALEFCPQDGTTLPGGSRPTTQAALRRPDRHHHRRPLPRRGEARRGRHGPRSYAARHVIIDKRVAIKVLKTDTEEENAGERFIQEAKSASKIGHANIVDITDFGIHLEATAAPTS